MNLLGNPSTGALRTKPWQRREANGIYVGHDRSVWMYRELPLTPLQHEDAARRLEVGRGLEGLLEEIGARSKDVGQGISMLAQNRSVHIFSATFERLNTEPAGTPSYLSELFRELLPQITTDKALLVGVKLRSSVLTQAAKASGGVLDRLKAVLPAGEDTDMSLDAFASDYADMEAIFRRQGTVLPRAAALAQLESWWNRGQTPDCVVEYSADSFRVPSVGTYQISAVQAMPKVMNAPSAQWLLDAMTHESPALAVSIRGELEPHTVTRARLRRQRRRLIAQEEEEQATGDLGREENSSTLQAAQDIESYVVGSRTPWLTGASILLARVEDGADDTFAQMLAEVHSITAQPLMERQLEALNEMQPASATRVNPFPQDLNLAMVSYAGLPSFSNLGDANGVWVGNIDPDFVPSWLDPFGAARQNLPPVMGLFGDPGSGKALRMDAKILTPSGWRRNGDLAVGDLVFGSDGLPHALTGVYPQGEQDIYRVMFSDGSTTDCTRDHLWSVATSGRLAKGRGWQVRSVDELMRLGVRDGQGKPQWRIPLAEPVQLPVADLPLDPYLVGALIGDGNLTHFVNFSTADEQIRAEVEAVLPQGHVLKFRGGYDYQVQAGRRPGGNAVKNALVELGLWGHKSNAKFVPAPYLLASVEQRVALLQGLIDTDGEVLGSTVLYTTVSSQLAADVTALAQSLGGTATRREVVKSYPYKGEKRTGQVAHVLTICLPAGIIPARLARKVAAFSERTKYRPSRRIESIELVGRDEAQCIRVDAADRLFVTEHFVLTHNTFAAQLIAGQAALAGMNVFFVNPKGFDTLAPWVDWVRSRGVPARTVSLSKLEEGGGAFDPFVFCADPHMASEILSRHIQGVLADALTARQGFVLSDGLAAGARAGVRCAMDALAYVEDPSIVDLVHKAIKSSTLFALAFANAPRDDWANSTGLTLIEFDRQMDFPAPGKQYLEPSERLALAALRLTSRAAMELLMQAGGGVYVIDEAHHYLASTEGMASLDRLGREGRSMGLLPIFITQKPTDLLAVNMDDFLSRVLCMKLSKAEEARAALTLCRLAPTPERLEFLRTAGPRRPSEGVPGRPALGIMRDLNDRHAVVTIGPVPEYLRMAMSTNRTDRELRDSQDPTAGQTTTTEARP